MGVVDDVLHQDEIIKNGYGRVAYLCNEYKYTDILKKSEVIAKENNLGIWANDGSNEVIYLVVFILLLASITIYLQNKIKRVK